MNPNLPLQLKRGLFNNLPASAYTGEPLVTLDTFELFLGGIDGIPQKITDVIFSNTEPSNNDYHKLWIDISSKTIKARVNDKWIIVSNGSEINKVNENLSDQINENNKFQFITKKSFSINTLRVILNGLEQTQGINNDYTIIVDKENNGIGIMMSNDMPLITSDVLHVTYTTIL